MNDKLKKDKYKVKIPSEEELAYAINLTGGKEVSTNLKKIIHLYAKGDIDYENAVFVINDSFKKNIN